MIQTRDQEWVILITGKRILIENLLPSLFTELCGSMYRENLSDAITGSASLPNANLFFSHDIQKLTVPD